MTILFVHDVHNEITDLLANPVAFALMKALALAEGPEMAAVLPAVEEGRFLRVIVETLDASLEA